MSSIIENRIEDKILSKLKELLNYDSTVSFVFIFGSYVRKRQKGASDIDIAIYFNKPPDGIDLLHLINKLSDLTGKNVDLIVLNSASAFLRHQVMKHGIPLIIKDKTTYRQFREKTICDCDEYKFVSGMNIYDR
jgi:predicted nucleotidyltransferase